jgi:hypothetical protein
MILTSMTSPGPWLVPPGGRSSPCWGQASPPCSAMMPTRRWPSAASASAAGPSRLRRGPATHVIASRPKGAKRRRKRRSGRRQPLPPPALARPLRRPPAVPQFADRPSRVVQTAVAVPVAAALHPRPARTGRVVALPTARTRSAVVTAARARVGRALLERPVRPMACVPVFRPARANSVVPRMAVAASARAAGVLESSCARAGGA